MDKKVPNMHYALNVKYARAYLGAKVNMTRPGELFIRLFESTTLNTVQEESVLPYVQYLP